MSVISLLTAAEIITGSEVGKEEEKTRIAWVVLRPFFTSFCATVYLAFQAAKIKPQTQQLRTIK